MLDVLEDEDEDEDEAEDDEDDDGEAAEVDVVEDAGFEAGVLLDEAPRLSFR